MTAPVASGSFLRASPPSGTAGDSNQGAPFAAALDGALSAGRFRRRNGVPAGGTGLQAGNGQDGAGPRRVQVHGGLRKSGRDGRDAGERSRGRIRPGPWRRRRCGGRRRERPGRCDRRDECRGDAGIHGVAGVGAGVVR